MAVRGWLQLVGVLGSAWIGAPVGAQLAQLALPAPLATPLGVQSSAPMEAQLPPSLSVPPPPPVLPELMLPRQPEPRPIDLARCVANLGQVGCAAKLYAQLLCDNIGLQTPLNQLHQNLQSSFEQAAIDFQGITPSSIETAAVRYYTPQLCPLKSEKIIDLMQRQSPPSQARSLPASGAGP